MLKEQEFLSIPIRCQYGVVNLYIVPSSDKDKLYKEDNPCPGICEYQLVEAASYQYEFEVVDDKVFQFVKENDIIKYSSFRNHHNMGSLKTGIYVGLLELPFCEKNYGAEVGVVRLEVRSVKSDYERDYRVMLDEIAGYYTDLVLLQGSPVKQRIEVDENSNAQTLYQKFSFVRSIIDSESFQESIHKIITSPVRKWTETTVQRGIEGVRHLSRRNIHQIAISKDRIALPSSCGQGIPTCLSSIPRTLDVDYKRDTIDNQENQFVKFALRTFAMFCSELRDKKNASARLKLEVDRTIDQISSYLCTQFFRQISMPSYLNMNSPVLQRKEGYREVLQAWLVFDLAAKLNWTGGNQIYEAGKKNVATLYEYWLFFKLQELISEFFDINPVEKAKLVKHDADNIDLNLIQGHTTILKGKSTSSMRELNVAFYYNRTFSKVPEDKDPLRKAGSWTMALRPDYTLSMWPGDISESEAEAEDLVVHIHFDAKYRLDKVVLQDDLDISKELKDEKIEQELGIYKRADLLKMHAYKDAIRRTSGAYVLYPGTENRAINGFHEIIPGLGAFCIRPGHWIKDSLYLKQFLAEIKAHMLDRTSEREKMSYYHYDVYKKPNDTMLMECLPEPFKENRDFLPDETIVIVAYYKDKVHLNWILNTHLYNVRSGDDKGSMRIDENIFNAKYLLLHNGKVSTHLIKIRKGGPKVLTRAQLLKKGYPAYIKSVQVNGIEKSCIDEEKEKEESSRIYLVFDIFQSHLVEKELQKYTWNINDLLVSKELHRPKPIMLSKLMMKAIRDIG